MSHEDGDVSMASLQEDGANMSVDEGTIDIVWQSTQPPAIQTMLQESKLHKRRFSSTPWNESEQSSILGSKSLFRDPSTSQVPPAPSLPKVVPADLRKVRPSQRRAYTQVSATQGPSTSSDLSLEKLESLREMINSVGKSWSRERQASLPTHIDASIATTSKGAVHSSGILPQAPASASGATREKVETATRKVAKTIKTTRPQVQIPKKSSDARSSGMKELMLPPAVPLDSRSVPQGIDMGDDSPSGKVKKSVHQGSEPNLSMRVEADVDAQEGPPNSESPSPPSSTFRPPFPPQNRPDSQLASSRVSLASRPSGPAVGQRVISQPQSSKSMPKKALGMRRTSSSTHRGISPTPTPIATNAKSIALPTGASAKPLQRIGSMEYSPSLSPDLSPTPTETAPRRSFKVPWADGKVHITSPTAATTTTTHSASQSSSDSARSNVSCSGSESAVAGEDLSMTGNPDTSFSFDDIDPLELHQVLDQCGA